MSNNISSDCITVDFMEMRDLDDEEDTYEKKKAAIFHLFQFHTLEVCEKSNIWWDMCISVVYLRHHLIFFADFNEIQELLKFHKYTHMNTAFLEIRDVGFWRIL